MKTPLGRFRIGEKIGADAPAGHDLSQPRPARARGRSCLPTEDLIVSRILWLDGLEEHNANTRERFIYIHGTNHEDRDWAARQPRLHPDEK